MGGKSSTVSNSAPIISSLRLQTSAYGRVIPVVFGKTKTSANLLGYWDFTPIAHTTVTESGGKGGGGGVRQESTTYTYTAALLMAVCAGEIAAIPRVWRGKSQYTLADLGLSLFDGDFTQLPFGYLTSNHLVDALNYRGIAYLASGAYDLGDQAQLDNHNFEIEGLCPFSVGIRDANPRDVVTMILTDPDIGSGLPLARLGDLTQMSNFCVASGIFISPAYQDAQSANEVVEKLARIANCGIVNSEGLLKILPYGDEAVTGNGATYTPNLTPQYELTDDDFQREDGDDPVVVERGDPADAFNYVAVKIYNRDKDYAEEIVDAKDDAHIEKFGLRPMPTVDCFEICDVAVARVVVQLMLQRALYVRNKYHFRLNWSYALPEPMDIVTLTESSGVGLQAVPVLIRSVEENSEGDLSFEAEDFPAGVTSNAVYPAQSGQGYLADYNVDPGDVNTPVIFDAPGILTASGFEIWVALSGGSDWGGCQVWVSEDDAQFKLAGTLFGRSRHGELSAILPAAADPDASNTLSVDLTISGGDLSPASQGDVDNFNTLMLIERELVAYRDATLTAPSEYDLDYLRRGVYNSPIVTHAIGAKIARLDQALFRYAYDSAKLGSTIYLKFLSFNVYGFGQQGLADVSSYPYAIVGSVSYPDNVTAFSATQNGNVALFRWAFIDVPNVEGYEIRIQELGNTDWDTADPLTQVTRGTQITTARVPPGEWTFLIAARDTSKNYSRQPTRADLLMVSEFDLIVDAPQAPDWLGTKTNLVETFNGRLIPDSTLAANAHTNAELFEQFVPYSVASGSYEAAEIDLGLDGSARIWASTSAYVRPDAPGLIDIALEIDYRKEADSYDGFEPWTIGTVEARRVKQRILVDCSVSRPIITQFRAVADAEERTETVGGLAIGPTGTAILFERPFFLPPSVSCEGDDVTPLFGNPTGVTETGFTEHLYNITTGAEVGGIGKYTARGV